jgi:hypothetical protein
MRGEIKRSEYAIVVEWAASCQERLLQKWSEFNERD